MISNQQVEGLMAGSGNVLGPNGDKIGAVGTFYLDDQTNEPAWVTVNTGLFGTNESFVPLSEATVEGVDVLVPYSKDEVKNSPQVESDGSISPEEEVTLYRYYGFTYDDGSSDSSSMGAGTGTMTDSRSGTGIDEDFTRSGAGDSSGTVGHDTSGPTTDDAMTRSEERLDVGTQSRQTGKARLRKYVVTETVTTQVPVSHEEVRVEREPITDANIDAATSGPELSEEEHEVTLHAEEPVVSKKTVPVERVRLDTETVTDTESVTEEVSKEQIDTDVDGSPRRSGKSGTDKSGGSGSGH
ncbi:YsnF/AvaK domain-containing protein [Arthrobacter sp. zg-Y820]|uniref:YsnF/AvaK domain-containing protein n=1 Tax=unclassified Arthrobacter TaxID=235627 RepID=UPI001E585B6D|nr:MULTISPECIES: YsnF/AvaK domain-containing protein [unclassified Arthrobacter]MCC9197097.1 YsnF/AvaK domain-containing protein [Arthrobacter sp. zg-Y820]MDK1279962.1 YsnF/AvaK domain-containing protein [Arthrobacter sp. zg.Y820]MDK1361649.1 YsnF/AvaK domain-containing protein [Arthrobacter sp. zg-Y1219]WIB09261.1 YsnF/AvaK domain-containing protein [Arthrobacter sp. zg-Y820]